MFVGLFYACCLALVVDARLVPGAHAGQHLQASLRGNSTPLVNFVEVRSRRQRHKSNRRSLLSRRGRRKFDYCHGKKYTWAFSINQKCHENFGPSSKWSYTHYDKKSGMNTHYCKTGYKECRSTHFLRCCTKPVGTSNLHAYCKVLGLEHLKAEDKACMVAPPIEPIPEKLECLVKLADCLASDTCNVAECFPTTTTSTTTTTTITTSASADDYVDGDDEDAEGDADSDDDTEEEANGSPALAPALAPALVPSFAPVLPGAIPSPAPAPTAAAGSPASAPATAADTPTFAPAVSSGTPAVAPASAAGTSSSAAAPATSSPVSPAPGPALAAWSPAPVPGPAAVGIMERPVTQGTDLQPGKEEQCEVFQKLLQDVLSRVDYLKKMQEQANLDEDLNRYVQNFLAVGNDMGEFRTDVVCESTVDAGSPPDFPSSPGDADSGVGGAQITATTNAPAGDADSDFDGDQITATTNAPAGDADSAAGGDQIAATTNQPAGDADSDFGGDQITATTNAPAGDADSGIGGGPMTATRNAPKVVVKVNKEYLTKFVYVSRKMTEVVKETETKVVPFELKWWRYRWEYTVFEMVALIPSLTIMFVMQYVYWQVIGEKVLLRLDLSETPVAMNAQFAVCIGMVFVFWFASRFPTFDNSLFQWWADANNRVGLIGPQGYFRMNAPFLAQSYYETLVDIMMHGCAALGFWTLMVYIIIHRFIDNYEGLHKKETTEQSTEQGTVEEGGLQWYSKQERDLVQGIVNFVVKKGEQADLPQTTRQHLDEITATLTKLGINLSPHISQHEIKNFSYDQYVYQVYNNMSRELAVPQIASVLGIAGLAASMAVIAYLQHVPFSYFMPLVFLFAAGSFAGLHFAKYWLYHRADNLDKYLQDRPGVTPQRLSVWMQIPQFTLCYSTTRVLFSDDMFEFQFAWWCLALFFFVFSALWVWFKGSVVVQEALKAMMKPPNITVKDLNTYLQLSHPDRVEAPAAPVESSVRSSPRVERGFSGLFARR